MVVPLATDDLARGSLDGISGRFLAVVIVRLEPTCFSEAVSDPRWQEAMKNKIEALERNGTRTIMDLPPKRKAIGCKWVYMIKYKFD